MIRLTYQAYGEKEYKMDRMEQIKLMIEKIDSMLDDPEITDLECSELEKKAQSLTAELGLLESAYAFRNIPQIRANDWQHHFLSGFGTGTRKITNKQAQCFRRINGGNPFIYNNRRYDCTGPNYRAGFGTLIVTKV